MHFRRQRGILLTLHERRSRLTLARRLLNKDAELTADAIAAELSGLLARARRTITHDNGGEFAQHQAAQDAIGLRTYFCDPHSPWQRGSIENAHGASGATFPARPASQHTPRPTSTTLLGTSTPHRENASAIEPRSRLSPPTSESHLNCKFSPSRHFTEKQEQVKAHPIRRSLHPQKRGLKYWKGERDYE